jgi:pectate lyase
MKRVFLRVGIIIFLFCFVIPVFGADGFGGNTTGGEGGPTVTVDNNAIDFQNYILNSWDEPLIIQVSGTLNLADIGWDGYAGISSNKTIRGVGTNPTIIGNLAFFDGVSNVIFERLNITNPSGVGGGDGISVYDVNNIFITHCTLYDCADGCIDITEQSDYVTVSWCKFYYVSQTSHCFVNLIGADDTATGDAGKLHVTMHHNWWSSLCHERMPRVRFGQAHVYNNYYGCPGNGYCAGVGYDCQILLESCYFDNVNNAWKNYSGGSHQGLIHWNSDNQFVNTAIPTWAPNSTVFTPPYSYTLDSGNIVKSIVMAGAGVDGNESERTPPTPDPMTFATTPYATSSTSIAMIAATAADISGVEYYFTCTAGGGHDSGWQSDTSYTDTNLMPSTMYTYTVKARDMSPAYNETAASDPYSGTTLPDTNAPTPNPLVFDVAPYALDINSITMTATTAIDVSGVEYYFANITDPNHDSNWQDGTTYTDTGLTNDTTYTYSVIARDKSPNQNETAWSDEANATTVQYNCSGAIISDLDENCKVDYRDYALMAEHWDDVLPLTNNIAVNGTFDTDIVPGWQAFDLPSAVGTFYAMYDEYYGNPIGSALVASEPDITGASGHYLYQVIPVRAGKQYKLSAEWMGDLSGYVISDPTHLSNWAQVLVSFETSPDANTWTVWMDANAVMYAKVFGVANQNIDSTGTWPDWESITASQTNGPADGIFTASGDYMVVAFSEGGLPNSGVGYFYADNVKVEGPACSPIDLNGDCYLDWLDIQLIANDWLSCNRNPDSECLLP